MESSFPPGKFMVRVKSDHAEVFSSKVPYWRKRVEFKRGTVLQIEVIDAGKFGCLYRWWRTAQTYWISGSSPADHLELVEAAVPTAPIS